MGRGTNLSSASSKCQIETLERRRLLSAMRFVDAGRLGGAHDGTSWGDAFTDLQQALAAATAGDTIRVADGTYTPSSTTNRASSFTMKNGVAVIGGFAGFGAPDPDARDVALHQT